MIEPWSLSGSLAFKSYCVSLRASSFGCIGRQCIHWIISNEYIRRTIQWIVFIIQCIKTVSNSAANLSIPRIQRGLTQSWTVANPHERPHSCELIKRQPIEDATGLLERFRTFRMLNLDASPTIRTVVERMNIDEHWRRAISLAVKAPSVRLTS